MGKKQCWPHTRGTGDTSYGAHKLMRQEQGEGDWKGAGEGGRRLERCRRRGQEIGNNAWEEYKATHMKKSRGRGRIQGSWSKRRSRVRCRSMGRRNEAQEQEQRQGQDKGQEALEQEQVQEQEGGNGMARSWGVVLH